MATGSQRVELRGLDLPAIEQHLRDRGVDTGGGLTVRQIAGGKSNLTYELSVDGRRWVLRRPPLAHVLPTAHDMAREYRVIDALFGTTVPVPRPVLLCEDPAVTGASFYVMDHVDGSTYRSAEQVSSLGPERARAVVEATVGVLADLHALDPAALGLQDLGRPESYLARQVRRWGEQLDASRSRDLPGATELRSRLVARVPEQGRPAIVHGDPRLDNLLFSPDDAVLAVLDWEMATLGDRSADLALFAVYGELGRRRPGNPIYDASATPGYPDTDELVELYVHAGGEEPVDLGFHLALASFKLAVILEGIHYRHLTTTGADAADDVGDLVPALVEAGLVHLAGPSSFGTS